MPPTTPETQSTAIVPFGAELMTDTPTAHARNLGALACIKSPGTAVDDSTGAQDTIDGGFSGVTAVLAEITALN